MKKKHNNALEDAGSSFRLKESVVGMEAAEATIIFLRIYSKEENQKLKEIWREKTFLVLRRENHSLSDI